MAQFVDWDLAAATAKALGKGGPEISLAEATEVVAELRGLIDEAAGHVNEFARLTPKVAHHPVKVVDRGDWAAVNVEGLKTVITPIADRLTGGRELNGISAMIGPRLTGVQAGTVLAYLSGRVLGQFEVFSTDPGELMLVAPNIVEAERKLEAVPHDFRLWVCLHEVTHRSQFTAVPWMRDFFLSQVRDFADAAQAGNEQFGERLRAALGALADSARNPESRMSVLDIVQTPAQRVIVDRLTALMTVLEGHAEFVMDGVGPEVVPTVDEIRARFNKRRESHNPIDRLVRRLLGIEMKMRQYAEGHKFVQTVVERVGIDRFNEIWTSPQTLPTTAEIGDPDAWIERVPGASAGG
ncbi:MAG TPA: zinc-dependent metalloprotease [Micromonosporaceae bacterium]|nr:zinc-dependent metalloprotease [Micromonosporaceae bacterium]